MAEQGTALLREAASLMRERANATVRDGADPWYTADTLRHYGFNFERADSEHVASWHPAVALAVADWLDEIAETHEADPSDYCGGKGHADYGDEWGGCSSWWCSTVARALAVATAYLPAPSPAVGGPKEDADE